MTITFSFYRLVTVVVATRETSTEREAVRAPLRYFPPSSLPKSLLGFAAPSNCPPGTSLPTARGRALSVTAAAGAISSRSKPAGCSAIRSAWRPVYPSVG